MVTTGDGKAYVTQARWRRRRSPGPDLPCYSSSQHRDAAPARQPALLRISRDLVALLSAGADGSHGKEEGTRLKNLEDAKVVVAGGAGGVGEGIVLALLRQRARVVVTSRSEAKLRELQTLCRDVGTGELIPLVGDLSTEAAARELQNRLHAIFREVDVVVASLGSWWQGSPLTSVDVLVWERILQDNLTCNLLAVKVLVPLLAPKTGRYVHINSFSAEQSLPQAGPMAMVAAAQKSMALTLAEELKPVGIRVFELILGPVKTRQRARTGNARPDWYSSEEVGDYVVGLLTGSNKEVVHHLLRKR